MVTFEEGRASAAIGSIDDAKDENGKFVCPVCGYSDTEELGTVMEPDGLYLYVYCHECDVEFMVGGAGFDPSAM